MKDIQDLIKKLLTGEGKISLLLLEAKHLIQGYENNTEVLDFINSEINGYNGEDLPSYRKIKGKLLCDIQTPYGGFQKNVELAVGNLTPKLGIDLSDAYISDGVSFIEENLINLNSDKVERHLVSELVESLGSLVKHNNPRIRVVGAKHSFGKAGVQHILVKVRQELIERLQNFTSTQEKANKKTHPIPIKVEIKDPIKVFVTYAWEDDTHNDLVISFVEFLRKSGYDAYLDKLRSQNESAINFNAMMLDGIKNADKVIIILSPKYKLKAENNEGGVGMEYMLIIEDIKSNTNKYVLTSFGKHQLNDIVPLGLAGREVLDLKRDQDENNFNQLHAKLQAKNILNFSDVNEDVTSVIEKEIKPFKL